MIKIEEKSTKFLLWDSGVVESHDVHYYASRSCQAGSPAKFLDNDIIGALIALFSLSI